MRVRAGGNLHDFRKSEDTGETPNTYKQSNTYPKATKEKTENIKLQRKQHYQRPGSEGWSVVGRWGFLKTKSDTKGKPEHMKKQASWNHSAAVKEN